MSETKKMLRASGRIGSLTMVSRVLGFARDVVMASVFGTGAAADAFFLAFKIPNLFRRLFGEGTLNAAFIPVYSDRLKKKPEEARYLVANTLTILTVVLCGFVGVGILLAPYILPLIAFGWQGEADKMALSVKLLRILFPYLLFISVALLLGAVLNTHRKFSIPALSPAILNLCWLAGLGMAVMIPGAGTDTAITIVAVAVLAGGAGQLLVHIPAFMGLHLRFSPVFNLQGSAFREVITLVLPGVFGMAVTQINLIVDSLLATFLAGGSITALMLSNRLVMLPLGVVGVAVATALLPALAARAAENDHGGMVSAFSDALDSVFYLMVPAGLFLMVMAVPTIRLVYERGSFDGATSTPLTAFALFFYAAGLFAYAGHKIVVQAFYALKDTRTPVKVAAINMLLNIVLNIVFIILFERIKPGFGLGGLALGTALASTVNIVILLVIFKKRMPGFGLAERAGRLLLFAGCGTVAAAGAFFVYKIVGTCIGTGGFVLEATRYAGAFISMILGYVVLSYFLKIKELQLMMGVVRRR